MDDLADMAIKESDTESDTESNTAYCWKRAMGNVSIVDMHLLSPRR
jgi:hypothetical protein